MAVFLAVGATFPLGVLFGAWLYESSFKRTIEALHRGENKAPSGPQVVPPHLRSLVDVEFWTRTRRDIIRAGIFESSAALCPRCGEPNGLGNYPSIRSPLGDYLCPACERLPRSAAGGGGSGGERHSEGDRGDAKRTGKLEGLKPGGWL